MANKSRYKVEFSIDNLSMMKQQQIFNKVIDMLDYNQRQELHVTVTDYIGGKHFCWEDGGIDPDGVKCKECFGIDCSTCVVYMNRKENKNGKNNS